MALKNETEVLKNILAMIAKAEGTNKREGNPYDTIVGYGIFLKPGEVDPARGTPTANKPVSQMTFKEVKEFGRALVNATKGNNKDGKPKIGKNTDGSSAVGKYQLLANSYNTNGDGIVGNLQKLLRSQGVKGFKDTDLFNERAQDLLAIALLKENANGLNGQKILTDYINNPNRETINKLMDKIGSKWEGVPTKSESKSTKRELNYSQAINMVRLPDSQYEFVGGDEFGVQESKNKPPTRIKSESDTGRSFSLMGSAEAAESNPDGMPSSIPPKEDIGSMGEYSTYRSPNPTDQGTGPEFNSNSYNFDGISKEDLKSQKFKDFIDKEVKEKGLDTVLKQTPFAQRAAVLATIKESLASGPVITPDSKEAIDEQMDKLLIDSDAMDKRERKMLSSGMDPILLDDTTGTTEKYGETLESMDAPYIVGTSDADNQDALLAGGTYTGYEFDEDIPTDNPDELQDQSYPMGYEDPTMSLDDDQGGEYTGQDYTIPDYSKSADNNDVAFPSDNVVDREGMDYSEPEGVADISFFESLFNDVGMGDFTTEQDYTFEADTLNLNEGGHVEKEVDFVKDKESVEDSDNGDPPPGATPEEVADDVPAMLSEGEYVLPANVVRYLGLERVISMHRRVLSEIQQMEDLGMIQNVDEDGKPEDDDNEMKFSDKKPKSGSIEIVVASSKPKGIMAFDKGGFFDVGGEADPSADTFESNREMHVGSDPSVGSRDPGEIFQSNPEYSDFGARGDLPIVNEAIESFGDDGDINPAYNEGVRVPELTAQERTDMAIDVAMDSIDPEKITAETTNQFRQAMDKIQKDNPNTGMAVEKILDMVGVGRVVKAMEAFEGYMRDRRMEARNSAGAKAEARAAKEGIKDQVKINQMKMEAMNSAWAAPGFSRAEDLAWAGGASEMIPDDYGNDYEDGRDGMTPTRNNPTGVALKLINDLKSGPLSAQNKLGMAPSIMNIDVKPQPKDKKKKLASGGLMQKKKFNQGGAYIEGVGYRDLTEPLTVEGAFDNEVKTYEDVIAEMQGFTGKDRFPEERVLKGKELKKRRQQARQLPRIDASTIDPKISRRDPFIELQLKNAGVDTENYGSVVDAYRQGSTRILGSGSAAANRQLIKTLDNYAESKRMQYDGFTQKDLDNLPEGSTNKDALKKIFSTEIQFRQGDFGYPGDQQDFANVGENVGTGMNNPLATGAPFRPMQGATMKHDYLHASGPLKPELERLLKFEDEANLDQINRLTSYLNTQGDKKYVDPTHRKYVDNIFRNFEDFRGTGLWELDSERDPPKTMSSAIMGNQFVEGVGYR